MSVRRWPTDSGGCWAIHPAKAHKVTYYDFSDPAVSMAILRIFAMDTDVAVGTGLYRVERLYPSGSCGRIVRETRGDQSRRSGGSAGGTDAPGAGGAPKDRGAA